MSVRDEITALLDARRAALSAKDAAASVAAYARDAQLFDLPPPLAQPAGAATDAARAQQWFDTWAGPIATELRDLTIRHDGDLAWASGLLHLSGERTDGGPGDFWFRTTLCLERRNGGWRIVHEHNSFPMKMDGSGRAATDLTP